MLRWLAAFVLLCLTAFVAVAYTTGWMPHRAFVDSVSGPAGNELPGPGAPKAFALISMDQEKAADNITEYSRIVPGSPNQQEPVILNDGRVAVIDYQEVAAGHEGELLFVARELTSKDGPLLTVVEQAKKINDPVQREALLAAHDLVEERLTYLYVRLSPAEAEYYASLGDDLNWQPENDPTHTTYRRWVEGKAAPPLRPNTLLVASRTEYVKRLQEGEQVEKGQRLALINPVLAVEELKIKVRKLNAAEADRMESQKTAELFAERLAVYDDPKLKGAITKEEYANTKLQKTRYLLEEISKAEGVKQAESELQAALTTVRLHDVRARISGQVRAIYKNPGDAVKNLESVLRIESPARLRVEGQVDVPEGMKLHLGMKAVVEATRQDSPMFVIRGHLQEVHGVAVCAGKGNDSQTIIVSGSEDRKLCGWDATTRDKLWEATYGSGVRSVACTGPKAERRLVAAGTADGTARILDLDHLKGQVVFLADAAVDVDSPRAHNAPVTCIAFSPDGNLVATGGEDYAIAIWEIPSGKLVSRIPKAHKQAVTSVQFIDTRDAGDKPSLRLISAGRDSAVTLWTLADGKVLNRDRDFDRRTGDVGVLTSDGKRFLFDKGRELRLLSLADAQLEGMLQNPPTAGTFTNLALFAPDGQTILTNGTGDTGLQLWRAPDERGRGSEVRQFTWSEGRATCAAFAPDGSFAVTGTREDHQVLVWRMPSKDEVHTRLSAKVSLVEENVETGSKQVRIRANIEGKPDWLLPGTKARMVILLESK
jgi:WD40 repeat protein/biotin carboxyl carrier protein